MPRHLFSMCFLQLGKKGPFASYSTTHSSVFFFSLCVGISFIKERTSPCVTGELVEMPLNLKCNMCSYKFTEKNNSVTNLAIPLKLTPTAIQKSRWGCVHSMSPLKQQDFVFLQAVAWNILTRLKYSMGSETVEKLSSSMTSH